MFKPNRVGTPVIHDNGENVILDAWSPNTSANNDPSMVGNVINAAPDTDFGRVALHITGNGVVTAGHKVTIGQQFTIVQPLSGDTVGVEINAAMVMVAPLSALIVPFYCRLLAAGGAAMAAVTLYGKPTFFRPDAFTVPQAPTDDTLSHRFQSYKANIIMRSVNADLAGTYMHGFQIYDIGGGGYTTNLVNLVTSIRQLNDQQNVGYRDTLR